MNWGSLGWFAGGLASGVGVAKIWRRRRAPRVGKLYRIEGTIYAESAVVEDLVRRVPTVDGSGPGVQRVDIYLFRRGVLTFRRQPNRRVPGQIGEDLWQMESSHAHADDLAVELIQYGLARAGAEWTHWPSTDARGVWPEPRPLFPDALNPDPASMRRNAEGPEPARLAPPIGHYFKVGSIFYADEHFALTLDGFHGADFDEQRKVTVVPFWRRGHIEYSHQTSARVLPEQRGALHRIEPHLDGVALADLLVEIESMRLVSWGGEWARFPTWIDEGVATGPLSDRSPGRLIEVDGVYHVNEDALRAMISRIPQEKVGEFAWRGGDLRLRPTCGRAPDGRMITTYQIESVTGDPRDERVRAFVHEMLMHRLLQPSAVRLDFDVPGFIHRVGDDFFVDGCVVSAIRKQVAGSVAVRTRKEKILELYVPRTPALDLGRDFALVSDTQVLLRDVWIIRDASPLARSAAGTTIGGEETHEPELADVARALVQHQLARPGRHYDDWDGVTHEKFEPLTVMEAS